MFKIKYILTIVVLNTTMVLNAQESKLKNSLYFRSAVYYHYDGEPIIQLKNFKKRAPTQPLLRFYPTSLSIGYQRQLNNENFLSISFDLLDKVNLKDFINIEKGHYINRSSLALKIQYLNCIFKAKKQMIFLTTGIVFRGGDKVSLEEYVFYNGKLVEILTNTTLYRDFGILLGLKYQYDFSKKFGAIVQFNHTFYAFSLKQNNTKFSISRNVSFLSFGLAYNF
jgi:hypothetical protein